MCKLMKRHTEEFCIPENLEYFAWDEDLVNPSKPVVGIDLETDGLHWDCKITSFAVYGSGNMLLVRENDGSEEFREILQYHLDNFHTVWHNSSFDLRVLKNNGYKIPRPGDYEDTMIMAYVIDPNRAGNLSLAKLAPMVGMQKTVMRKSDFEAQNIGKTDKWLERNGDDAVITYKLWQLFSKEIAKDKRLSDHYRYIDVPMSLIIREMEDTGFYINKVSLEKMNGLYERYHRRLLKILHTKYQEVDCGVSQFTKKQSELIGEDFRLVPLFCEVPGTDGVNIEIKVDKVGKNLKTFDYVDDDGNKVRLKQRIAKGTYAYHLYEKYTPSKKRHNLEILKLEGWVPDEETPRTDSGEVKLDEEVINGLAKKYPFAKIVNRINKAAKLLSTYTHPFLSKLVDTEDEKIGLLRGQFNQCQTRTRRLSSSKPNLQNIPARGKVGKKIRELFVSKPGYQMIGGDDAAIEARILADGLAFMFKDNAMMNAFILEQENPKMDFHTNNAINWSLVSVAAMKLHQTWTQEQIDELVKEHTEGFFNGTHSKKNSIYLENARDMEKTALYGGAYGAGTTKLGNGDKALGELIQNSIYESSPGYLKFKNSVWDACYERGGYIYNFYGARGYYPDILSDIKANAAYSQRQSFNFVIQCTSYSRMCSGMLKAHTRVKKLGAMWSGMVHDEILLQTVKKYAQECSDILTEVMSSKNALHICPVSFEVKPINTWLEQK